MLERVGQNMGAKPVAATADAGYFSGEQVNDERIENIDLFASAHQPTIPLPRCAEQAFPHLFSTIVAAKNSCPPKKTASLAFSQCFFSEENQIK
jgi:hypothetical protein